MQPHTLAAKTVLVIDENGSLNQFYSLAELIRGSRHVKYTGKTDDIDNIQWRFKYRGHPLTLQYNIYDGLSIFSLDEKDNKSLQEIFGKIKAINA